MTDLEALRALLLRRLRGRRPDVEDAAALAVADLWRALARGVAVDCPEAFAMLAARCHLRRSWGKDQRRAIAEQGSTTARRQAAPVLLEVPDGASWCREHSAALASDEAREYLTSPAKHRRHRALRALRQRFAD